MTPKLRRALFEATDAVEVVGGRYAIVDGLAVGAWAIPRATRDVDLYTDLDRDGRSRLKSALETTGFHVPAMEEEIANFGVFRAKSKDGVFVDVFDSAGPLGEAILSNRQQAKIGGRSLWFVAATELAALKAFSDRPRDFDDLAGLVRVSSLDATALDVWAKQLDASIGTDEVSARIEAARRKRRSTD
jgi:hypothetical protein